MKKIKMIKVLNKLIGFYIVIKKNIINNNFYLYKGIKRYDLIIFDDIFPHPVSGFRYEEFSVLLSEFVDSKIMMKPTAYFPAKTRVKDHKRHVTDFFKLNNNIGEKLKFKKGFVNINTKLFYCVFINNIYSNIDWIEENKIPFVFTLYPGGGFQIYDRLSDLKLKKVLTSKMFRKVIVTQLFTKDYLIKNDFCKIEEIEYIFGGVSPQISFNRNLESKKSYLINKSTFDICFCAAKYSSRGEDKGYDVFIDFAHQIVTKYDFIRFHIIGGFGKNDIEITQIKDKIHFYGYQNFEDLGAIYQSMDVLVSPNKPFVLGKGSFDGFPLGTVVEAVLNGVVTLISDELKQNTIFKHNEELIIIESKSSSIEKEIIGLINDPEKRFLISKKGRQKFMEVYSDEIQMKPRIELLRKEILKNIK